MFDATKIIETGGVLLILLLVFAETGLLLGLVIPGGETLIFTAGILVSTGTLDISIALFLILLILAGLAGDFSGFYIGRRFGPRLYKKEDTWYFKKAYLDATCKYINRHKKLSIIFGKFLSVIRPFIPLIAGVTKLERKVFFSLSLLSSSVYMASFLLAGFFLGNVFPGLKKQLGWILPVSLLILLIPVLLQIKKIKRK